MGFVPKRVHSPSDFDLMETDHARKKYISEQFANEMAALSLGHNDNNNASTPPPPAPRPFPPTKEEIVSMVKTNINGSVLPLEQRQGDGKLRIPEFILRPPPLTVADHVRALARYPSIKWRSATPVEEYKVNQGEGDSDEEDVSNEAMPMDID